jgi:small-conductance mechanosensitive channel
MTLVQLMISAIIFVVTFLFSVIATNYINKVSAKRGAKKKSTILVKRSLNTVAWFFAILIIAIVWGINIQNLWVAITGIIAITAIGFFAVWSILSNVIAGMILFFSKNFNLGEEIEILPEKIKGQVISIHSMFTIIEDKKGNKINIPNNLILQRMVKRYKEVNKK